MKKILSALALSIVFTPFSSVFAIDLTNIICNTPEMSRTTLTRACKDSSVFVKDTICQGNEGEVWCKSANLELGSPAIITVELGFRNRHVNRIRNDLMNFSAVIYDSSSSGTVTAELHNDCSLRNHQINLSNSMGDFLTKVANLLNISLTKNLPESIPNCS
ncbi:hypothetical protein [Halomonas sp. BN3-1]|uniref:hypothetical protein n=1 Tax=Halomonas sp. BN3-1 TaxID=2082393 RepID=UPI0013B41917|nr:hypothetical protein [Halomonas sp. BN3-1]